MIVLEEDNKLAERDRALEEIAARLGVRAERGRRFAELTSLRVGGAIDWVIAPDTEAQAAALPDEVQAEIEAAVAFASASPLPSTDTVYENVF